MQHHSDLPQAFADLGLEVRLLKAIRKLGFTEPSPIQSALIPPALERKDILGQARTGTGKTAAFALPILQQIFTVLHAGDQELAALGPITILALVFSVMTIWRKSIVPAIVAHFLFDWSQFLFLYYSAGDNWI